MLYLPPYSPVLSSIEEEPSGIKGILRRAEARTREALVGTVATALDAITAPGARGYFGHCAAGYHLQLGQPL